MAVVRGCAERAETRSGTTVYKAASRHGARGCRATLEWLGSGLLCCCHEMSTGQAVGQYPNLNKSRDQEEAEHGRGATMGAA